MKILQAGRNKAKYVNKIFYINYVGYFVFYITGTYKHPYVNLSCMSLGDFQTFFFIFVYKCMRR